MIKIFNCRRSSLALISIVGLFVLGFNNPESISGIAMAVTGIVTAVSGANAYQKAAEKKYSNGQDG